MLQIPLSKARTASHEWAYRFAPGEDYRRSPDSEPIEVIPGTECRNTGCCDMSGRPIFEHDYVKKWHYIEDGAIRLGKRTCVRCSVCDVGEMLYVDGILCKRVDGLPDAPLPYQYLHDPYEPLRLCFNEVVGNSVARRRNTFRKTDIQLAKERKDKKKKHDEKNNTTK